MSEKQQGSQILSHEQQEQLSSNLMQMIGNKTKTLLSAVIDQGFIARIKPSDIDPNAKYRFRLSDDTVSLMKKENLVLMRDAGPGEIRGGLVNNSNKLQGRAKFTIDESNPEKALKKQELAKIREQKHIQRQLSRMQKQLVQIQMQNLAIMHQLMKMTEVINDVRSRVIELQEMHDNDLIGGIIGMRDQLLQIRHVKDAELMKNLLANCITRLNGDRGSIEREIIALLGNTPSIPKSAVGTYLRIIRDDHFCDDVAEKYNRIEKLFSMYLLATLLLGYGYAYVDESQAYTDAFMPNKDLVENDNLIKLVHAERILEGSFGDTWYKNPEQYLGKIGKEAHRLFSTNNQRLELQISGADLLEVLTDADKTSESETQVQNSSCDM